jgi:hypothetical protein
VGINAQLENGGPLVDMFGGNIETAVGYLQSIAGENETIEQAFQRLQQVQSSYYQKFYSQEERQAKIVEQARTQIDALNESLSLFGDAAIDTKAEYRAHIESLELASEAGKRTATSMLELQDALLIVEEANRIAQVERESIVIANPYTLEALGNEEYADLTKRAQTIADNYAEELSLINNLHSQRLKQLQEEERIGKELLRAVESLLLSDLSTLTPQQRFLEAQAQFAKYQVLAESGDVAAAGQLQSSGQAYLKEAQSYYASGSQYQSIFGEVSGIFSQFGAAWGDSESVAKEEAEINQQQLAAQERLLELTIREVGYLSGTYDELRGIFGDTSVIAALLAALPSQLSSLLGGLVSTGAAAGVTGSLSNEEFLESIYGSVIGRSADSAGLDYWNSQLESGALSREDAAAAVRNAAIENGEIPAADASIAAHVSGLAAQLSGLELEQQIYRDAVAHGVSAAELEQSNGWAAGTVSQWAAQNSATVSAVGELDDWADGSHAKGLGTVPFDGYRAELHHKEMVLPAPIAEVIRGSVGGKDEAVPLLQMLIDEVKLMRTENRQAASSAQATRQRQITSANIKTRLEAIV